jgi:tRNA(Ile)-lysidine synthase TilS/MesJ
MIEIIVSCNNKKYTEEVDAQDYFDEEEEEVEGYFSPLKKFHLKEISKYNGRHFIFGWWECFVQSDDFPLWLHDDVFIEVVKI